MHRVRRGTANVCLAMYSFCMLVSCPRATFKQPQGCNWEVPDHSHDTTENMLIGGTPQGITGPDIGGVWHTHEARFDHIHRGPADDSKEPRAQP